MAKKVGKRAFMGVEGIVFGDLGCFLPHVNCFVTECEAVDHGPNLEWHAEKLCRCIVHSTISSVRQAYLPVLDGLTEDLHILVEYPHGSAF